MELRSDLRIRQHPQVYPPSEDTFLLLSALEVESADRFLEVGTGTGIIALHAAAHGAWVVASDVNPRALQLASQNAKANDLCIALVRADLLGPLQGPFDVVAFNPPYLPRGDHESSDPRWTGGAEGGEILARFLLGLPAVLHRRGRALVIISSLTGGDWRGALEGWAVEVVGTTSFPFEELQVLSLRPKVTQGGGAKL